MLPLGHGSCQGGGSVVTAAVGLAFVASAAAFAPVPVGRVPASLLQLHTATSPGALRAPRRRALVSLSEKNGSDKDGGDTPEGQSWPTAIVQFLNQPTGDMFAAIIAALCKPRISIGTSIITTGLSAVMLSVVLISIFFVNLQDAGLRILDVGDATESSAKSILLFGEVLRDLEEGYVDKVDADKLFQTAAEAMTASLDPYTEFETKKVSEDNFIRYNGRYAGVGMGIERDWVVDAEKGKKTDKTRFRVSSALEGYAWDAGIRPGDHLVAIDGEALAGKDLRDITDKLRGEAGTSVAVTF